MFNLFDFSATPGTDEANDPFGTAIKPQIKPSTPVKSAPVPFVSQEAADKSRESFAPPKLTDAEHRFVRDMLSQGVPTNQIFDAIIKAKNPKAEAQPKPEVDKGFFDSVGDSLNKRASTLADVNSTMSTPTQVAALAGEGVGFI